MNSSNSARTTRLLDASRSKLYRLDEESMTARLRKKIASINLTHDSMKILTRNHTCLFPISREIFVLIITVFLFVIWLLARQIPSPAVRDVPVVPYPSPLINHIPRYGPASVAQTPTPMPQAVLHPMYSDASAVCRDLDEEIQGSYEICYNPDRRTIFFIHFNNWTDLDACAVTTAAIKHPNHGVCVLKPQNLTLNDKYVQKWTQLGNVEIGNLEIHRLLEDTALLDWYIGTCANTTAKKYILAQASDALRLAYLFKYGGIYMDTDILTLKPMDELSNVLAYDDNNITMNNAVMIFDKGNEFVEEAIELLPYLIREDVFASVGPHVLTRLVRGRKIRFGDLADEDVQLLPPYAFYPFYRQDRYRKAFTAKFYKLMSIMARRSYAIHLYRSHFTGFFTGEWELEKESFVGRIMSEYCL